MLMLFDGESAAQKTLRLIEEKGQAGLWKFDLVTRTLQWSAGVFQLLGLPPDSLQPSIARLEEMIHPADARPPGEFEHVLREGGSVVEREFRIVRPDGRVRWLRSRGEVLFDRTGTPLRAVGIVFDITDFRDSSARFEAMAERYAALVEEAFAIVWTANAEGSVNDMTQWCRLTGQTISEAGGEGWLSAIHPDDAERVKDAWQTAVRTQTSFACEFRLRHTDANYRWVRSRAVAVRKKDRSIREWIGIAIDIHEQKVWSPPPGDAPLTGAQIRAARAIANWSVRDLADASAVSAATIRRLEEFDGVPSNSENAVAAIRSALMQAGIEFLFPPTGKPAVRPH